MKVPHPSPGIKKRDYSLFIKFLQRTKPMDVISLSPEEDREKRRISLHQAEDKYP